MPVRSVICTEQDLRPYFKEMVETTVSHQQLELTDMSQFYIVNLLNDFSKTDQLFDWKSDHFEETPLAVLLSQALGSNVSERIRIFKKIGDSSLYIAGYFSEHIDSHLVDIDYYISMGSGAYENLGGIFSSERTFFELYAELSDKFELLVNLLSEIKNSAEVITNSELLRLYERWLRTKDPKAKERLQKEGMILKEIDSGKNH